MVREVTPAPEVMHPVASMNPEKVVPPFDERAIDLRREVLVDLMISVAAIIVVTKTMRSFMAGKLASFRK